MKRRLAAFLLPLLFLAATPAAESPAPLALDTNVLHGVLPNGITYYVRSNPKPEKRLELRLVVNAGSLLEADDQQGLAHFLEHIAFNGTEHFAKNELVDFLESLGVGFGPDLNAYTSFDETVYQLRLPTADRTVLDKGFLILADWAGRITASDEAIAAERGVVIEEWRGRRGADQRVRDLQYPVLFHESRYAQRLPIGKLDILQNFDFERLRDFYRQWYRPDLMAVIAVGDMPAEDILAMLKASFESLPAAGERTPRASYIHPPHDDTKVGLFSDPELTEADISVFFKMPYAPARDAATYRRDVLAGLATSMLRQRFAELAQKANPPFLGASAYRGAFTRGGDVFMLSASVRDQAGAHVEALRAMLQEAERARRHGFTQAELDRTGLQTLRSVERMYNERNSTESVAFVGEYKQHFLEGIPAPGIARELELHREILAAPDLGELNRMLGSWMAPTNRVVLGTAPSKDGVANLPTEAEVLAVLAEVESQTLEPYVDTLGDEPLVPSVPTPGSVVKKESLEALGLHIWTLSNGARVLLKPTDFKKDQVLFNAWSAGGYNRVPDERHIPASTADTAVSVSGIGAFSAIDLRKKLAGKLVNVAPGISGAQETLGGSSAPEDLETFFQLVHLYFTQPRGDAEAFAAYRQRTLESLRNRLADPKAVFGDIITATLSNHHPRLEPWTTNTVDLLDLDASLATYRERFANAGDFTFLFIGAFEPDALEPLLAQWIASLPATGEREERAYLDVDYPRHFLRRTVRQGMEPVSEVHMVWTTDDFVWNYAERHAIQSMVAALRIRLREVIREKLGGTYHVSVWPDLDAYPKPRARLHVEFGCAPDKTEELIAAVTAEIQNVSTQTLDAVYVTKVQETQRRTREVDLKRNEFWNYVIPFYEWYGEDPLVLLDFDRYVDAITPESIRDTAKKYFGTPHHAVFVLLPEDKPAAPSP